MLAMGGMFKEVEETTNMVDTKPLLSNVHKELMSSLHDQHFPHPLPFLAIMPPTLLFTTTTKTLTYWHVAKQTKEC